MKPHLAAIALSLMILTSCGSRALKPSEEAGIDAVLTVYDGTANYRHGNSFSANNNMSGNYFELELNDSPYFKQYPNDAEYCTPIAALLLFRKLSEADQKENKYYRIKINTEKGATVSEFTTTELQHIGRRAAMTDSLMDDFVIRNYNDLCDQFYIHPDSTFDCQAMFKIYEVLDNDLGRYQSHFLFAMRQGNMADVGERFREFIYMVDFERGSLRVGFTVSDKEGSELLYGFQMSPPNFNK